MSTATRPRTARPVRMPHHDPAQRPMLVTWESTRACQLACRHCRAVSRPLRDPRELTTAEAKALMDEAASFGKPAVIFIITGGDCFERPDLAELVAYGSDMGLHMAVSPSGTDKLNKQSLARIQDAGAGVISLSLDGATAATHDAFRGVERTFDRTVAGWQAARELGMKVQINSVVARHNVHELPDIAALVREYGAMTWSGFLLVPTGRGVDLGSLDAAEIEDVLNIFYDMGEAVPAKTTEGHHFRRVSLQRYALAQRGIEGEDMITAMHLGPLYRSLRERIVELGLDHGERRRRPPITVSSGNGFMFISHVGDVTPSGFLEKSAGNVREASLTEIYRNSEVFTGVRDAFRLKGKCGECEYNRVCGGSRARAFNSTGDLHAEEPLCAYQPGSFPYPEDVKALLSAPARSGRPA
ncbi:TIGR04053 family radical SAM/SPASM domain-containing protein [Actinomyces glycerinitolerans]|uniref:Aldolase-type tim barrel n=1 Tax=Actinomyces glycerinitolerans TaxID=1892869 RepID=A0A1M4S3M7_9ACTO|nr:TIGR04053 family radical SAM/SPASM domain-containing protein [Actinomyces glycerinitolerans]SHE26801.1 aldolase-type tim barrel [Actinomyces glycerinitolerans]